MCVCKINVRRVRLYPCTYLRILLPPFPSTASFVGIGIMQDGITFVTGFSLIILTIQRVSWAGPIHPSWTQTTHCCSFMLGRSTHTTWAFGMAVNSFLLGMCSVSLFQRRVNWGCLQQCSCIEISDSSSVFCLTTVEERSMPYQTVYRPNILFVCPI